MRLFRLLLSALFCILAVAAPAADNYSVHRRYLNAERTPDKDSHNNGAWKAAKSEKDLLSREKRLGTYDENFKRIGD